MNLKQLLDHQHRRERERQAKQEAPPVEFTPEPEQPVESAPKKRRRARAPRD